MNRTSEDDLAEIFTELGVRAGDRLFIHAFLPSLGVVEGGMDSIVKVIQGLIGSSGCLIVPTFSASYRRNEVYDVKHSKSFNGAFSEYVRSLPGAVRSLCPMFSMAAIGANANSLMERPTNACFGKGSVYEKLFDQEIKFIGLGVDWNQGYSFFMHLEKLAAVPYRDDRVYQGLTRLLDGSLIEDDSIHFVRREDMSWCRDRRHVCESMLADGLVKEFVVGGCPHRLFNATSTREAVLEYLADDPWCMTDRRK